ncbi:hypothetical protein TNCV_612721 [Trichonephila clavipes]|nr:hypothetical protein TNCV_612721 [Trichonephila clavipes]
MKRFRRRMSHTFHSQSSDNGLSDLAESLSIQENGDINKKDNPRAAACLCAERFGDCSLGALAHPTFSGVVMVRGWSGSFFFIAEPVFHPNMDFSIRNGIMTAKLEPNTKR